MSENTAEVTEEATGSSAARNYRKTRQGYVVSDKMDKTVVVLVEDRVKHALYGKVMRRSHKVKAHDEGNAAGIGDRVLIMETRPLSATKRWRVVEILEKAK
ncbi:30S ribosomal protein S17 [Ornithinicoccus halotolerans]|uniref:30S ribosomal protein S17 n=1 Tax=Ornithinicoccus halotolerans TaxID=1748220 RepID=UPI0012951FD2|nr:30S ribosomal protein S17 [Ornithinicoccus halotolerans]